VNAPNASDLRAGIRVSVLSIAWTVAGSAAAIATGIVDGSLVLIVFGLTGLLDAAGSLTLALHFRHALAHEAVSERRERIALHVVSAGLIAVGVSTVAESLRRLIVGGVARHSSVGIAIAAASALVLPVLTVRKRVVAGRLESDALRADGWLSATGAVLAMIAVAGSILAPRPGLAWIDPAAALVIAAAAAAIGVAALRREESALPQD
jgi:divalent metal cation (Fe/Co/Zn/Cd) transporter